MERPETRFAWNGDVSLAFPVVGRGPTDLLYLQGYCSQVDLIWDSPYLARFLRGLSGHGRLVVTDRRGWVCSERFTPGYVSEVDVLTNDILAVLEAAESERAMIVATYESSIVASLFAASYPERTSSGRGWSSTTGGLRAQGRARRVARLCGRDDMSHTAKIVAPTRISVAPSSTATR